MKGQAATSSSTSLERTVGVPGAVLLGLGSILGTGVFVSLGMATAMTGGWVLLAIGIALLLATFNGLSSAQLAAAHPVSGGTYEYGIRLISPSIGFTAGWLFLCAKSASAASAALGASIYLLAQWSSSTESMVIPLALLLVILVTLLVLSGLRRSNWINMLIVLTVIGGLGIFLITSLDFGGSDSGDRVFGCVAGIPEAVAIVFVAFTGYGRIATLGEEIRNPQRSIPPAIILTLCIAGSLYLLVGAAMAWTATPAELISNDAATSSLQKIATRHAGHTVGIIVSITAIVAMIGVLLNLVLGLSRVSLAMGRRGDMPGPMAKINLRTSTPWISVIVISCVIGGLVLIGDLAFTWSLSALTVLIYYAITNLAALQLPPEARRFPRWTAMAGLILCVGAAFSLPLDVWLVGGALLLAGFVWKWIWSTIRVI